MIIYTEINNPNDAYIYYQKALESLDENVDPDILAELYFKFALVNDDKDEFNTAFEYYNKALKCFSEAAKKGHSKSQYYNENVIGIKTGYTGNAGYYSCNKAI